jgi:hypothetical protein
MFVRVVLRHQGALDACRRLPGTRPMPTCWQQIVRVDRAHHRAVAGDSALAEGIKLAARTHQNLVWDGPGTCCGCARRCGTSSPLRCRRLPSSTPATPWRSWPRLRTQRRRPGAYRASRPSRIAIAHGGDETVELSALDPHGATEVNRAHAAVRDLALDAAARPAQLGRDLVEVEQQGGLGVRCGVHDPQRRRRCAPWPYPTQLVVLTTPVSAHPTPGPRSEFWGPSPHRAPSGCRTERRP